MSPRSTGPCRTCRRSGCPGRSGCDRSNARSSWPISRPRCGFCSRGTAAPKGTRSSWLWLAIRTERVMTEPMRLRVRVAAPIAEVWRALTDPAALRVWLAEHAVVALPHRYQFWGRYTPDGDRPHQRPLHVGEHSLRFAWLLADTETTVHIGLTADGPGATILALSQTDVP